MSTATPTSTRSRRGAGGDARTTRDLGRAVAVLRVFTGVVWLSNGVAKLLGTSSVHLGALRGGLIDRGAARGVLEAAVASSPSGALAGLYRDVALAHWGVWGAVLTAAELAVGLGLVLGLATRLAALGGLALIAPVWVMTWPQGAYLWEYPLDLVPLLLLAVVPAGRVWGLDARLAARGRGRWPS